MITVGSILGALAADHPAFMATVATEVKKINELDSRKAQQAKGGGGAAAGAGSAKAADGQRAPPGGISVEDTDDEEDADTKDSTNEDEEDILAYGASRRRGSGCRAPGAHLAGVRCWMGTGTQAGVEEAQAEGHCARGPLQDQLRGALCWLGRDHRAGWRGRLTTVAPPPSKRLSGRAVSRSAKSFTSSRPRLRR